MESLKQEVADKVRVSKQFMQEMILDTTELVQVALLVEAGEALEQLEEKQVRLEREEVQRQNIKNSSVTNCSLLQNEFSSFFPGLPWKEGGTEGKQESAAKNCGWRGEQEQQQEHEC